MFKSLFHKSLITEKKHRFFIFLIYRKVTNACCRLFSPAFSAQQSTFFLSERKAHGMKGGDSSGTSETAETPQERSDEEAWPRPRKASTRNGMCSPTIDFFIEAE